MNPNKARGHDMISINMLEICGGSISRHIQLMFRFCIMNDVFPFEWKRAKVVSVQKKGNKQLLTNYQTILWQPISDKNFELLQFSEMYEFLEEFF